MNFSRRVYWLAIDSVMLSVDGFASITNTGKYLVSLPFVLTTMVLPEKRIFSGSDSNISRASLSVIFLFTKQRFPFWLDVMISCPVEALIDFQNGLRASRVSIFMPLSLAIFQKLSPLSIFNFSK